MLNGLAIGLNMPKYPVKYFISCNSQLMKYTPEAKAVTFIDMDSDLGTPGGRDEDDGLL